jgi:cytochrome c biogenesis protein CcmG/thiol:disulfide interchange protein DsbE
MPLFERFAVKFSEQVVFVGANMEESRTQVLPFVEKIGISYPILLDPQGEAVRLYKVIALPNTFFIDAQGVVQYRHIGLVTESQLAEYLAKLGVGE